jgi:hypothetical protein
MLAISMSYSLQLTVLIPVLIPLWNPGAPPGISPSSAPDAEEGAIMAAKKSQDPETLSFDEAMADVERELWIKTAELEIHELEAHGVWIEVPLSEANGEAIAPATWVFCRKRSPAGDIKRRMA